MRWRELLVVLVLGVLGWGVPGMAEEVCESCNAANAPLTQENPFGLFLAGDRLSAARKLELLTTIFAVPYYRPSTVFLDRFAQDPTSAADVNAAVAAGLKLVLVVRANGTAYGPSTPVADPQQYKALLNRIILKYKGSIAVLVIEHEPDTPRFWSGTMAQYLAQVKAAGAVAHAHSVPVAAGGLSSTAVLALTAERYLAEGQPAKAVSLLRRTRVPSMKSAAQARAFLQQHATELARAKVLLAGIRAAGVDYLNFHWYEPDRAAFDEAIECLWKAGDGLPLMTDELGQRNDTPQETTWKLTRAREYGLPFVIWFAMDAQQARSLVNEDGALRPTGEAFRKVAAQ